jgi:uncharacterized membrane protein YdbT with pleckstrin-like domain
MRISKARNAGIPITRRRWPRPSWPLRGHWNPFRIIEPHETVRHTDTPSWKQLPNILSRQILLVVLGSSLIAMTKPEDTSLRTLAWIVIAVVAFQMFVKIARWWFTRYTVTTDRLIVAEGVWKRRIRSIPHSRITQVHFTQSVLERLLGLATVEVRASGQDSPLEISNISAPYKFHQALNRAISGADAKQPDAEAFDRADATIEFGQGDFGQGWTP